MKGMLAYKPAFVKVNIYMVNSSYICENWAQLCFLAKTVKKKKKERKKKFHIGIYGLQNWFKIYLLVYKDFILQT